MQALPRIWSGRHPERGKGVSRGFLVPSLFALCTLHVGFRGLCLKAVNMMGPSRYLEHSIAIHVLLSSFPGDPQVAAYAIDQIQTQNFPFVSLNFGAFELLAKSFRDYAPLVAAIDEWAPKQQHRDPELSHAALVGRTPVMKQILLQDLRTSTLPFWAANALTAGWGLEDAEVRAGLVDLIKGPVAKASAIAHYGPQLLSRDEAKSRLDEMLADPTSRWHGKILHTLAEMPLSESERRGVATPLSDFWTVCPISTDWGLRES